MIKGVSKQDKMAIRVAHAFATEVVGTGEEIEPTAEMLSNLNDRLKELAKEALQNPLLKHILNEDTFFKWLSDDLKSYLSMTGKWNSIAAQKKLEEALTSKTELKYMVSEGLKSALPGIIQETASIIEQWFDKNREKVTEALSK